MKQRMSSLTARMLAGAPINNRRSHSMTRFIDHRQTGLRLMLAALSIVIIGLLVHPTAAGTPSAGAAGVIDLETLNGSNGYRLDGANAGDFSGKTLHNVGDVNDDGYDDFAVGAPLASPNGLAAAGEVYVIFGTAGARPAVVSLKNLNGSNGFRLEGATTNDQFGAAIGRAGDVNGDGYHDIIIGAPGADLGEIEQVGEAYVILGKATFAATLKVGALNGSNGFRLTGDIEGGQAGASVSGAGDLNGDGYEDMMVGAPEATVGQKEAAGQVYVVFGRSGFPVDIPLNSLNGQTGFIVSGGDAEDGLGNAVAAGGDVNGDGYGDLLASAWKTDRGNDNDAGVVYVVFGATAFPNALDVGDLDGANGSRLEGIDEGDRAGRSVGGAGDVNGDGYADIIIGSPFAGNLTGESYVVFGAATFPANRKLADLDGGNGFRVTGAAANSQAGASVAGAGDVNGDALDDLLIGAPGAGERSLRFAGQSFIVFGKKSFDGVVDLANLDGGGIQLNGGGGGDQSGQAVSGAGDTNGDGFEDILIGAPKAGTPTAGDTGASYLVFGGSTLGVSLPVTHPGTPGNDDLNGSDGDDVMVGGRGNDRSNGQDGADALKGGAGADLLIGGPGGDRLAGGLGDDGVSYTGSATAVTVNLFTGRGDGGDATGDLLRQVENVVGSNGADTLTGNGQRNRLEGGPGDDQLTGRAGGDIFVYAKGHGNDAIADFKTGAGGTDLIDLGRYGEVRGLSDLTIVAQGRDAVITLPDGSTITLREINPTDLNGSHFRFGSAPLATSDFYTMTAGNTLKVAAPGVLANDENPDGGTMTAALVDGPENGALTFRPDGSFDYAPQAGFVGSDSFTYYADNGSQSNVAKVTIRVNQSPPTAVDDGYTAMLGRELVVAAPGVLENDQNPGGQALRATLVAPPVHGALALRSDGSFSYTPQVDYATSDSFTYRANNGLESNTATVRIRIVDPDAPPLAVDDRYEAARDTTLDVQSPGVLSNDQEPLDRPMTAVAVEQPAHGKLDLNSDGSFRYTPAKGFSGIDTFTYKARSDRDSNVATVTIAVRGVEEGNRAYLPVAVGR